MKIKKRVWKTVWNTMEISKEQSFQIMFIDNDQHVRESLKTFFEHTELRFLIFKSALEGLNSLKYQDIDVVISDYFLPDMDGIAFLNKVAEDNPNITRILMATIVNDDLKAGILESGIDRFIEKPLTVASLDTILTQLKDKCLSKKRRR
ncbi:MAG: response regulator [Desulfobacteraceae bacterium]|nr:response regulator [Desulfobacteraceae bacterium]